MKRLLLATFVIAHGFAHAAVGAWAVGDGPLYIANSLWAIATVGFLAAGLGILRTPVICNCWKRVLVAATIASILLLVLYGGAAHGGALGAAGVVVDIVVLFLALDVMQRADVDENERSGANAGPRHPKLLRFGWAIGAAILVYAAAVVLFRPTYLRWGTTADERAAVLPGDDRAPNARYRVDHAITIHAPVDSVWPWLVQLGQDRGGFYSYSRLERLIGDRIENADRVHPEWQHLAVGDTVFATQPDYFGGRFGKLGWRVGEIVPGRAIILENWGAFVLVPLDSATTRFIVRTRGPGDRSLAAFILGPLSVFVMEPAHFIMQRGMLRGVRDRAERRLGAS